jgi:hypothetical protein
VRKLSKSRVASDPKRVLKLADKLFGGKRLTPLQREVVSTVWGNRLTAVATGHGVGKGYVGGLLAMLFGLLHKAPMVVITAPTGRQAKRTLWHELRSRLEEVVKPRDVGGSHVALKLPPNEVNQQEWRIEGRTVAVHYTAQPDREGATAFQGLHAPSILVLVDEAAGVDDKIIEAATTLVTGETAHVVLMGNPTNPGKFQEAFRPGSGWATVRSSCFDHPNVIEGREVIAGAVTRQWLSDRWMEHGDGTQLRWPKGRIGNIRATNLYKRCMAHENPWWMGHVLGLFPPQGEDTLIPDDWVRAALGRRVTGGAGKTVGCDVARYGRDETVIIVAEGGDAIDCVAMERSSGPQVVRELHGVAHRHGVDPRCVRVDATGIGGMGVEDWLDAAPELTETERERWRLASGVEFGSKAEEHERFVNKRAELLWALRQHFEQGTVGLAGLDERTREALRAELPYLRYAIRGARIAIESKDEYRKRTGKSPDYAEALALALWLDPYAPAAGGGASSDEELLEVMGVGMAESGGRGGRWRTVAGSEDEDAGLEDADRELEELDREIAEEDDDSAAGRWRAGLKEQDALNEAQRKGRGEEAES